LAARTVTNVTLTSSIHHPDLSLAVSFLHEMTRHRSLKDLNQSLAEA